MADEWDAFPIVESAADDSAFGEEFPVVQAAPANPKKELSFLEGVAGGLTRGALRAAESIVGLTEMLAPTPTFDLGSGPTQFKTGIPREKMREGIQGLLGSYQLQPSESVSKATFQPSNWRWWTERSAEFVPQLAAQLGAAFATGGSGIPAQYAAFMATSGGMEAGSAYIEALERTKDTNLATGEALAVGIGTAALDAIPGAAFLRKNPAAHKVFDSLLLKRVQSLMSTRPGAALGGFTAEGVTEAAQAAWADTARYVAENDPKAFEGWKERYAAEGFLGGGAGAGFSQLTFNGDRAKLLAEDDPTSRRSFAKAGVPPSEIPPKKADREKLVEQIKTQQDTPPVTEPTPEVPAPTPNVQTTPIEPEGVQGTPEASAAEIVQPAQPEPQIDGVQEDRRGDMPLRQRVDALAPENRASMLQEIANLPAEQRAERIEELMQRVYEGEVDPVTELPTRRVFQEMDKAGKLKPFKLAMDIIGLGGANDKVDYAFGDALLKTVAKTNPEALLDTARWGGDELMSHGNSIEELKARGDKLNEILKDRTIRFIDASGKVRRIKGARVVFGIGQTTTEAAGLMEQAKEVARATGVRPKTKGKLPGFMVEIHEGGRVGPPERSNRSPGQERQDHLPTAGRIGGTEPIPQAQAGLRTQATEPTPTSVSTPPKKGRAGTLTKEKPRAQKEPTQETQKGSGVFLGGAKKGGSKAQPQTQGLLAKGHRVSYVPEGKRKPVYSTVKSIQDFKGKQRVTLTTGEVVDASKVSRLNNEVIREQENATLESEHGKKGAQRIEKAASDTRILAQRILTDAEGHIREKYRMDPGKPLTAAANRELQEIINRELARRGYPSGSKEAQADSLPFILQELLPKVESGEVTMPALKSVEIKGQVGEGDKITLAGREWKVTEENADTVKLEDHDLPPIEVPQGMVPIDKGTKRKRGKVLTKAERKARTEFEVPETTSVEPRSSVETETDLLGRQTAKLTGDQGTGEQGAMFEQTLSPEEKKAREIRKRHKEAGGKELFGEDAFAAPLKPMSVSMTPGATLVSPYDIFKDAAKAFGVTFRAGRVANPHAAGIYKNLQEVIRHRRGYEADLAVFSHELAHHVDNGRKVIKTLPLNLRKELKTLDYEPQKARAHEGFAEYLRHYLTEDDAATFAPQFHPYFTGTYLPAHPQLAQKLTVLRGQIDAWRQQGAEARASAILSQGPERSAKEHLGRAAYAVEKAMLDRYVGLKGYVEAVNKKRQSKGMAPLKKTEDPYVSVRVLGESAPAQGAYSIENGVFSMVDGRKLSDGLQETFNDLNLQPGELETFTNFMVARHALDLYKTGRRFALSQADAQFVFDKYKDRAGWTAAAKDITAWNKALVQMYAEVGGISKDAEKLIMEAFPAYVPLKRMLDTVKGGGKGSGAAIAQKGSPVKRMSQSGSGLQVIDPFASMIQSASQFYEAANKVVVAKQIIKAGESVGGMGEYFERIPTPQTVAHASLERLAKDLEAAGADLSDADMTAVVSLFQPTAYKGNEPIVTFQIDGKMQTFQLHPDLHDAISRMETYQLPAVLQMTLGTATKIKRAGAVELRASFGLLFNPARDIVDAMVQTRGNVSQMFYRTIGNYFRVAHAKIQEARGKGQSVDVYYRLAKKLGGEASHQVGQDVAVAVQKVEELVNNADKRRAHNIVTSPKELMKFMLGTPGKALKGLQATIGVTESGPRLAEMQTVLEQHGYSRAQLEAGAVPPMPVLVDAMLGYKRVTTDFSQKGTVMQAWNRVSAFSNAKIQGNLQPYQNLKANPIRYISRGAAILTLPTIAYWLMVKDEEWYEELPPWQRFGFWNFRVNGHTIAIPKPFIVGYVFSSIPEMVLDTFHRKDPKRAVQLAEELLPGKKSAFQIVPDAVLPALEVISNYDSFRDKPIVGQGLEDRQPKDQYYSYNTAASKYLGTWLEASPAKVDHLLHAYSGGLGTDVLRIPEEGITRATGYGRLYREVDSGESVNEFYKLRDKTTQEYNSRKDAKTPSEEVTAKKHLVDKYADLITDIRNAAKDETDEQKKALYKRYITGLSRLALGKSQLESYPSIFKADDLPAEMAESRDKYLAQMADKLATARPTALSAADRKEGITFPEKLARYNASREEALEQLRLSGVEPSMVRKAYWEEIKTRYKSADVKTEHLNRLKAQLAKLSN